LQRVAGHHAALDRQGQQKAPHDAEFVAAFDPLLVDDAPLAVQVGGHQSHAGRPVVGEDAAQRVAGERRKAARAGPFGWC